MGTMTYGLSTVGIAQAATGGTVTITEPQGQPMTSLDPTQWAAQILVDQGTLLEGLYGYNQRNEIVPKIATGYKISNGGRTWTFTLRKNARWSNGDPVTAHDFYYAFMRQLAPSDTNAQLWANVLNNVVNSYAYHAGSVPASQVGLKVINNYTLQITTNTPHDILGELAMAGSMPLNQKAVEAHPTDWYMPQYFVGDGPYMVKSFTPNGELVMVKNPKYVGASGQVNFGNASEIRVVPGTTVPVEDFMAGKQDVALIGNTSDLKYINDHATLKAQLHSTAQYSINYLAYDESPIASPLDNVKVRQAIAMAIQRAPIVNSVLSGMGGATNTFEVPNWFTKAYETGVPTNIAKAQQLLKEAGYPGGKGIPTLTLYTEVQAMQPNGVPTVEALAQELQQYLGIKFNIVPLAATQYGFITYGGPMQGILPGFNLAVSGVNNFEPSAFSMGGDQLVYWAGSFGYSQAFRKHVFPWYNNAYNPADVKAFGDPNNAKVGLTQKDWTKLASAAHKDIAYISSWTKKQPAAWQTILNPPTALSLSAQWNGLVKTWRTATSPSAKHAAWVQAFDFVAPHTAGDSTGALTYGVEGTAYWDQYESTQVKNWRMWQAYFVNATNQTYAAKNAGKLMTQLMQQGWVIPLFYSKAFYLERSTVTGAQINPWSWGNFYEMQYLSTK